MPVLQPNVGEAFHVRVAASARITNHLDMPAVRYWLVETGFLRLGLGKTTVLNRLDETGQYVILEGPPSKVVVAARLCTSGAGRIRPVPVQFYYFVEKEETCHELETTIVSETP